MPWHFFAMKIAAEADPPKQWETILELLTQYVKGNLIDKIEVASFAIRGKRKARWLVDEKHSEFASVENSIGAAKKLTGLLLNCENGPGITNDLYKLLKCSRTASCVLLEGHAGDCENKTKPQEKTTCPMCKEVIKLSDFDLDATTDLLAIQMGHLVPLSRKINGHHAQNVVWVHRRCNYIQDEQTVTETIETLRQILERHGYKITCKS